MHVLTLNTGSSSLKAGLYDVTGEPKVRISATVDRIGGSSVVHIVDAAGRTLRNEQQPVPDHSAALHALLTWLVDTGYGGDIAAIGHRVVHGGKEYSEPQPVTPDLLSALRALIPIDPDHLPQAIETIDLAVRAFPSTLQVACFDTAFHRHMPHVSQIFAIPQRFQSEGVIRYGFHGLSYEFIMQELHRLDREMAQGRVIIAHLGNGASMAAVREGIGVDTTMGFTPTGGLVMGTRSGDLDPGVLLYLLQSHSMTPSDLNTLLNRQSGLLGLSGISADMRDLLSQKSSSAEAAEAVEVFCYSAKKFIGALAAVLGGLDTLVFTGGMGEHAAPVRARICAGMEFLGIELHAERNDRHGPIISTDGSRVTVRVMHTDEDAMIAKHTKAVVLQQGEGHVHV